MGVGKNIFYPPLYPSSIIKKMNIIIIRTRPTNDLYRLLHTCRASDTARAGFRAHIKAILESQTRKHVRRS